MLPFCAAPVMSSEPGRQGLPATFVVLPAVSGLSHL